MKPDLRTRKGLLQAIYNTFEVRDKVQLNFIRFNIPKYDWQRVDYCTYFHINNGCLDNTDYNVSDLRFVYQNIHNARYFTVTYLNGSEMVCENTWDSEIKQQKLSILCQKVS